ncbi:degenerin-like protein asic-2 [Penaeus japonicus]|uniref:degenerin-like protein asic-2 n=1 Tax=Penaeus japonicus TaxID=27405 RepID=UPI001C70F904|nr:degenerin-like protein asic-2 [Penaeus japonicus]
MAASDVTQKKDATMAWTQRSPGDPRDKKTEEKKPLRQELSEQMDIITIGGLSHVWAAKGPVVALFWGAWSLFCLALLILNSISILSEYFSYPVSINVISKTKPFVSPPAITVCPMARVSCRRLALGALQDAEVSKDFLLLFGASQCCFAVSKMPDFEGELSALGCEPNGSMPESQMTFDEALQETEGDFNKFCLDKEDIFLECSVGTSDCLSEIRGMPMLDFSSKNCFTIFREETEGFNLFSSGVGEGITLILKTDVADYPGSGLAQSSGFLVQVHHRNEQPNPMQNGVLVSPSTETRVALRLNSIERKQKPYPSQCILSWEETGFVPILLHSITDFGPSSEVYIREECNAMCVHRKIIQDCQCYLSSTRINFNVTKGALPGPASVTANAMHVCTTKEELKCLDDVNYNIMPDQEEDCNCRPECKYSGFTSSISTAPFPTTNYEPIFRSSYNLTESQEATKLVVYLSSMEEELQKEEPRYKDYAALLSALGGILGLYLGLSLLILAELVLLLLNVILWCFK